MSNNTPNLTLRKKQEHSPARVIVRGVGAILGLVNPLVLIMHLCVVLTMRIFGRGMRVGRKLLAVGVATTSACILLGWHTTYFVPWRDSVQFFYHRFDTYVSIQGIVPAYVDYVGVQWKVWLLAQLPFALTLTALTSGAYLTWRDYYSDDWRLEDGGTAASVARIERAKRRQTRQIDKAAPVTAVKDLTVPLGVDAIHATPVSVPIGAWRTHALVCGPTGVGKTQTLMRIMHSVTLHPQASKVRVPLVVVDMKGDPDLARYMAGLASATGRNFHYVTTLHGSYNPLSGLSADEIADAIYETVFAHDQTLNTHYATLSRRLLQTASRVLIDLVTTATPRVGYGRPWQRSLSDLTALLSLNMLRRVQIDLTPPCAQFLHDYLDDIEASENKADVGDVRDRLAVIVNTTAGQVLAADGFSLYQTIRQGDLVLFSLDAAGTPETARTIGTLAVQDITATFGRLQRENWAKENICPVILDEFSALGTPKVADLYARARSAGGAVILATQDVDADLTAVSPEFAASVRTNANIWIVLRQNRADVAEAIARDIGSRTTWKETKQVTDDFDLLGGLHAASGVGSLREVEEFIVHPGRFKDLPQGGAYLIVKIPTRTLNTPNASTQITRLHINAPQELTAPLPGSVDNYVPSSQGTEEDLVTPPPDDEPPLEFLPRTLDTNTV